MRLRFPPVLPRRQLEASGYLASFPHLAGTIYAFEGSESQAAMQSERAGRHEDWGEFQQMTELALMPAACYPVYPAIAAKGRLAPGGVFVDAGGAWVFRHEPSHDPARRSTGRQCGKVKNVLRSKYDGSFDVNARSSGITTTLSARAAARTSDGRCEIP